MGILSGLLGNEFFVSCYTPLGELMDMLALTNCMINFILYCIMSRQFRLTFKKIFGISKSVLCFKNSILGRTQRPIKNIGIEKYLVSSSHISHDTIDTYPMNKYFIFRFL